MENFLLHPAYMIHATFMPINRRLHVLMAILLFSVPCFTRAQFTIYNPGQAFTCISIDSNYNIWAGTSKAGIFRLNKKSNPAATQLSIVSSGSLSTFNIQALAADQSGNVWAGHNGSANTASSGGGIERISMDNPGTVKHYVTDANAECLNFIARDGIASSNSASLTVDKSGTVWSAHKYHDLFVAGIPPSIPAQYILTPGSLSYKPAANAAFITKGTFRDYRLNADDPVLPYPEYTCNAPIDKTAQTRNCYAVATGNNLVMLSVIPYQAKNGTVFPARLLLYNLEGKSLGSFDTRSMKLSISGVFSGMYITPQGKFWVTTSAGRVLYFDGTSWRAITFPAGFPPSVIPNYNAITGDKFGNVYIGTTSGLVVCKANPNTLESSYTLYTAANGLPSSNVRGVAAEKNGNIWLATDAGIVKFSPPAFVVYNLINPVPKRELEAGMVRLVSANDKTMQTNGKPIELNAAADSSRSTLIVYTGASPETHKFTLAGIDVEKDAYRHDVGKIELLVRNKDSLVYIYHHPNHVYLGNGKIFTSYGFGLRDSITRAYAVQGTLNIYHAPVLMVHGVWSSIKALEAMKNYLLNISSNYKSFQLSGAWFPNSNHSERSNSVFYYRDKIPTAIDQLLEQCRDNGLSAGKVNYVGHSRGGLFARYYLQNTFRFLGYPYRNDIHTLITVNSPHFGSQTANLILDKRTILGSLQVGDLFKKSMLSNPERPQGDDPDGAMELRVEADAIIKELNGLPYLNNKVVPSHAITSQYLFGDKSKVDILKTIIFQGGSAVPDKGALIQFLRLFMLSMGTACVEGPVDNCLREIFNTENNDIVVPLSSQRGGLENKAVTFLKSNLGHSSKNLDIFGFGIVDVPAVMDAKETHERVAELLRQDPDDDNSAFTKKGFHPGAEPLRYTFLPNLPNVAAPGILASAASQLSIDQTIKGKIYRYGEAVPVTVTGSGDIKTLLIAYSSTSLAQPSSTVQAGSSFVFSYPVPKEASGTVLVVAYGFNDAGLQAIDSSYINIGIPANVTLDSIRVQKNEGLLQVAARDSIALVVTGFYSDTVRDISHLPGISYSFVTGGIASASQPNYLKGITPGGYDQLRLTYANRSDTVTVQVTDSVPSAPANTILPVQFLSFSGTFTSDSVYLSWTTEQEESNKQFEVQYSLDGAMYEPIGVVAGKGNSNRPVEYRYATGRFQAGVNYYRLKQIDQDGRFSYSPVVTVIVNESKQTSLSIYPNPAARRIIVALKQPAGSQLLLQLTNMAGQQVWSAKLPGNAGVIPVDLPALTRGLYIIQITGNKGEKLLTEKLMIR